MSAARRLLCLALVVMVTSFVCEANAYRGSRSRRQAQSPEEYFAVVVDQFDDALRSYGIFNLPVHDYTQELNDTIYDIDLVGKCDYSFGTVTSIDPLSPNMRFFQYGDEGEEAYITGYIDLPNIDIVYDYSATLTVGDVSGTATHGFPNNQITVEITRNQTVENSVAGVSFVGISAISSANVTEYIPDTNVTQAIARIARLRTSTVLWDDFEVWNSDIFLAMLEQIVDSLEFPL